MPQRSGNCIYGRKLRLSCFPHEPIVHGGRRYAAFLADRGVCLFRVLNQGSDLVDHRVLVTKAIRSVLIFHLLDTA